MGEAFYQKGVKEEKIKRKQISLETEEILKLLPSVPSFNGTSQKNYLQQVLFITNR